MSVLCKDKNVQSQGEKKESKNSQKIKIFKPSTLTDGG
jgi:Zn ribbon nucleic-acid-binding protein